MNKWSWIIVLFLVLAPLAKASGTEAISEDGEWWSSLDESQQLAAVQGALDAYETGVGDGALQASLRLGSETHAFSIVGLLRRRFPHTFGYYMAAITSFYAEHPTASKATIGAVMTCLSESPFLSCSELATASQ